MQLLEKLVAHKSMKLLDIHVVLDKKSMKLLGLLQFQYPGLREPWILMAKAALQALLKLSRFLGSAKLRIASCHRINLNSSCRNNLHELVK